MTWLLLPALLMPPLQPSNLLREVAVAESSDLAKTQARLEQLTKREPHNDQAWVQLAQVYAQRKKNEQALAAAARAETLGAEDPAVLQSLVSLYIELQPDLKKAAELEARYAERSPADGTAWRRAAALYLDAGLPEEAIRAGKQGLANDPSPELRTILGQAYTAVKDWENATEQLSAALRPGRHDEEAHFRLAQLFMLRHDYTRAVDVLLNARQIFGGSLPIELALGVCYYGQGRYAEAVDRFLNAIALAPDAQQPYMLLGHVVDHSGARLPEVEQRFVEFNNANPQNALGYLLRAKALLAEPPAAGGSQDEKALAFLRRSHALKPDVAEARYLLGCILERRGQHRAAEEELERSIALNSQASAPHLRLTQIYEQMGRAEDAARERELHQRLLAAEQAAPEKALGLDLPAPTGVARRQR